jgi:fatty-acyl-CoA synthase
VVLPLCGTFGLTGLMAAVAAHARVLVTDFVVDRLVALCDTERITAMNGSDDMFHRLMNQGADLSSLRCGGFAQFNASLTDICERADHIGATLVGLYGMSEVQALFAVRHPLATSEERARAGGHVVSPAADACIINNELCVRGPSLFAGYLAEGGAKIDDGLTSSHLYHDGTHTWFRTGDLATIDGDRSFEYLSRLGDVLRLGGYLVAPAEIIDVLCTAPGVADAQVVTVARSTGTRPVAFVISDNGHVIDEQAVIEHCAAHLARYKVPVRVVPIDAFPVTDGPNGVKIRLTDLRAHAAQLLGD